MNGGRVVKLFVQIVQENGIWRVTILDADGMTVVDAGSKAEARAIVNRVLAD